MRTGIRRGAPDRRRRRWGACHGRGRREGPGPQGRAICRGRGPRRAGGEAPARRAGWRPAPAAAGGPAIVLMVGVNGTGKTTTIGKLAHRVSGRGHVGAARRRRHVPRRRDRAAARSGPIARAAESSAHAPGADPAAVVYDALDAAVARGVDVVIADTAGRLHTKSNLMDELAKIRRVIDKRLPGVAPEVFFVLDATTGQNGLAQAQAFPRGGRSDRHRPHEARLDREGRHRLRHRGRPSRTRPVRRRRGEAGRPAAVRSGRLRESAVRLIRDGGGARPGPRPVCQPGARCGTLREPSVPPESAAQRRCLHRGDETDQESPNRSCSTP